MERQCNNISSVTLGVLGTYVRSTSASRSALLPFCFAELEWTGISIPYSHLFIIFPKYQNYLHSLFISVSY